MEVPPSNEVQNMLVLSRKAGEKIVITPPGSDPIIVTLVSPSSNGRVRIGIDAPPEVSIQRMEIKGENPLDTPPVAG